MDHECGTIYICETNEEAERMARLAMACQYCSAPVDPDES